MSAFDRDPLDAAPPELHLAPGPAAYSENGNGADPHQAADIGEAPASDSETLTWIATAPPGAVLAIAAAGAAFALLFIALAKVIRGNPN